MNRIAIGSSATAIPDLDGIAQMLGHTVLLRIVHCHELDGGATKGVKKFASSMPGCHPGGLPFTIRICDWGPREASKASARSPCGMIDRIAAPLSPLCDASYRGSTMTGLRARPQPDHRLPRERSSDV